MNLFEKITRNHFGNKTPILKDENGNKIPPQDLPDEMVGNMTDEKCPDCGANLLKNKKGDVWCSFVECTHGIDLV